MSRFSVETLKKNWQNRRAARISPLTPGIAGKIAVCVLIMRHKDSFVSGARIEDVFLENLGEAPEALRKVLHLDVSVAGISIREATEMILGVQRAEIAGRLNPEYDELHVKWSQDEAGKLLRRYENEFPEVVEWIRQQVENK